MKLRSQLITLVVGVAMSASPALAQFGAAITAPTPLNTNAGADLGTQDFLPDMATDENGNWVAVWYSLPGVIGGESDILMARSADNGKSWTEPAPLNNNAGTDSGNDTEASIATDGRGNWVTVWRSRNTPIDGVDIGDDSDLFVARSADNGATWSDPSFLNTNAATDNVFNGVDYAPHLVTDKQGNWLVVWHSSEALIGGGNIGSDNDILVARSTDNGETWTDPAALNNTAAGLGNDQYPKITTDEAGNWVTVWYSSEATVGGQDVGNDDDILVARSTDNGDTWSDPAPLNSNAADDSSPDRDPRIATDGKGHWVTVWDSGEANVGGEDLGADEDVLIARSTDNGLTWTDTTPLNKNATVDTGDDSMPQIACDQQGNWVVSWTSNEPTLSGLFVGPDFDILVSRSSDNGTTWTAPATFNTNAGNDSHDTLKGADFSIKLATDNLGNWVAMWSSREEHIAGGIFFDPDILTARFALADCNLNNIGDGRDIADGTSEDCNSNGVPDECEPDFDGDGIIDACDPEVDPGAGNPVDDNPNPTDDDPSGDGPSAQPIDPNQPLGGQDGAGAACGGGVPAALPFMLAGVGFRSRRRRHR